MANELHEGKPRIGWLFDGNPDTADIAVMLEDTGKTIQLTVPLQGMTASRDVYQRWWSAGISFGDDPDKTKYDYKPPRVLMMDDNLGPVVLVGCRATGYSQSLSSGNGQIVANYAVLGGRIPNYERIHGMRTEVTAWNVWTGLSAMKVEPRLNGNRVEAVKMTLEGSEEVNLSRSLNLKMKSRWRTNKSRGQFKADEGVHIITQVTRAREWGEHLKIHGALVDLVAISAWRKFGFSSIEVCRADDPERVMSGQPIHERWSPVATHKIIRDEYSWKKDPKFLFPYSEVGSHGIGRWMKLRQHYGLATGPMLGILRSDNPWSNSSVVQSGIALENLAYLIDTLKNGGAHLDGRKQMKFNTGLDLILQDMDSVPLDDVEGWKTRANATYMGLKHPDRPTPDSLVLLNTLRENLLVLRFWVAQQIGVKGSTLKDRLGDDPLAHAFELID